MKTLIVIVLGLLTAQCTSSSKVSDPIATSALKPIETPKDFTIPFAKQLTQMGTSQNGRFSPDGRKIVFEARREKHSNSQIYLYFLDTEKEKRLTHNDGENYSPSFSLDAKTIIYASTTDERKEHPAEDSRATHPITKEWLPQTEIYTSSVDGSGIERLTHSVGYDSNPVFSHDKNRILFSSLKNDTPTLFAMNKLGHNRWNFLPVEIPITDFHESRDAEKLVWSEMDEEEKQSFLIVGEKNGKHAKPLTQAEAIHQHPVFTPDSSKILFSSNRDDERNFELYIINSDGTCLKRLTYHGGRDEFPQLSPRGDKILFTSDRSGKPQLYLMDYSEPINCLDQKP